MLACAIVPGYADTFLLRAEAVGGLTTFVLVHGTGSGGWCWKQVARILRAGGSEVYAPTLSGVGDRAHLASCGIDLTTHITDVSSLMYFEDLWDVVLVGHSYAGMVITGVAATAPARVGQLIYLDAYVPDEGQCEYDLWPPELRADADLASGVRPSPPPSLMGITDPQLAAWVVARETPHPMATYLQAPPPASPASGAIPRAYLTCTGGEVTWVFGRFAEKARTLGWPVREIATGHDAMLIDPAGVAALLVDLAGNRRTTAPG